MRPSTPLDDFDRSMHVLIAAAMWGASRKAFLALPSGSPDAAAALHTLSEAEDGLRAALAALEKTL